MAKPVSPFRVQDEVRGPWRAYLDALEPLRPDLHRFCTRLTGSVWDGEDLVQDTLVRVFAMMGKLAADLTQPRAYFIRTATNLWIDRLRARQREDVWRAREQAGDEPAAASIEAGDAVDVRTAAGILLRDLSPRERAAVVMKDVLDLSLEETAAMLKTSIGAVKSALHRGRERLDTQSQTRRSAAPPRQLVEQFCAALTAKNIDVLQQLCSKDVTVELVGGAQADDFAQGQNVFKFAHMVLPGFGARPRWEVADYEGEAIVLGFRTQDGVEGLNEIHRLDVTEGAITRVRTYCFCPDTLRTVAQALGVNSLPRPYRSHSAWTILIYLPRLFLRFGRWWRKEQ